MTTAVGDNPLSASAQENAESNTWQVESGGATHDVRVDLQPGNTHVIVLVDDQPTTKIRKPSSLREWTQGSFSLGPETFTVGLRLMPDLRIGLFVNGVSPADGSSLDDFHNRPFEMPAARAYDRALGAPSMRRLRNVLIASVGPGLVGFVSALRSSSAHDSTVSLIASGLITWACFGVTMVGVWAVNLQLLGHPELPDRIRFLFFATSFVLLFALTFGLAILVIQPLVRL
jgi:hypothetical protein